MQKNKLTKEQFLSLIEILVEYKGLNELQGLFLIDVYYRNSIGENYIYNDKWFRDKFDVQPRLGDYSETDINNCLQLLIDDNMVNVTKKRKIFNDRFVTIHIVELGTDLYSFIDLFIENKTKPFITKPVDRVKQLMDLAEQLKDGK